MATIRRTLHSAYRQVGMRLLRNQTREILKGTTTSRRVPWAHRDNKLVRKRRPTGLWLRWTSQSTSLAVDWFCCSREFASQHQQWVSFPELISPPGQWRASINAPRGIGSNYCCHCAAGDRLKVRCTLPNQLGRVRVFLGTLHTEIPVNHTQRVLMAI
jgi:hypothetical protein